MDIHVARERATRLLRGNVLNGKKEKDGQSIDMYFQFGHVSR
jgi:hypothetical protein